MTTTLTARRLLTDSSQSSLEQAIAHASEENAAEASTRLPRLGSAGRSFLAGRIGRSFSDSLDADLTGLVATAWMRYDQVRLAIERTRDEPGTTVVVPVVDHTVTASLKPSVDVTIGSLVVTTVTAEIVLDITAQGVIAAFLDGELVDVQGGTLLVDGRLALEGITLASHRTSLSLSELSRPLAPRMADAS